jgi:hypothetical protein
LLISLPLLRWRYLTYHSRGKNVSKTQQPVTPKATPTTTQANIHAGTMKGGIAEGEPAKVIDYTIDGHSWHNYGIYCREYIAQVDAIKAALLATGPAADRTEQVFPRECHYTTP